MTDYENRVHFDADPQAVYDAFTTPEGLRGWWTTDCDVATEIGAESTFRFGEIYNKMKIDKLDPGREVRWSCTDQLHESAEMSRTDEWVGTKVVVQLSPGADGGTDMHFTHVGLRPELECFDICLNGWNFFLADSLLGYLHQGQGKPFSLAA